MTENDRELLVRLGFSSTMQAIPADEYREMDTAGQCCGSAGIYNLIHQEMLMNILDDKMKDVEKTRAAVSITTNPGCLLEMRAGIERPGLMVRREQNKSWIFW